MSTDGRNTAAAMATGIAAIASTPKTIAVTPAGLLLDIRLPVGGRRDRAADDTGDGDEREDVRKRLEQGARAEDRRRRVDVRRRDRVGKRGREPEQARRA